MFVRNKNVDGLDINSINSMYNIPLYSLVKVEYRYWDNRINNEDFRVHDKFKGMVVDIQRDYIIVKVDGKSGSYNKTILKKDIYTGYCRVKVL